MIKVNLQGNYESISINAMIDSGATEDFIDKRICDKNGITTKVAERPGEIYLADGNLSEMDPTTHIAEVAIKIVGHRELATLQVANLQNHEIILGMLWVKEHNPRIDWEEEKITFDSERLVFVTGPPGPRKTRAPSDIPRHGPLTGPGRGGFFPFPRPYPRPRPRPSHAPDRPP